MATVGQLNVLLKARIGKFLADFRRATQAVSQFSQRTGVRLGTVREAVSSLANRGSMLGQKFAKNWKIAMLAIVAITAKAIKTFADFERQSVRVAAISGDLEKFGDLGISNVQDEILALSKTTEFTATQVGEAFGFMAQSGLSMTEIVGAAPGVLQLASAAMIDVASAADIATNVMKGFGLGVHDLQRVNDTLIKTATESNTSVTQLGEAIKFVGPVAQSAGIEIEEVSAALGILGDAGIQGEMGGTALRGMLSKLLNPSKEAQATMKSLGIEITDTTIRTEGLAGTLKRLAPLAGKTGKIFEIFAQRAGPGVAVLLKEGSGELEMFTRVIEMAGGTAKKISEAQLNTLDGRIKILKSNIEALAIEFGRSLVPVLEMLIPLLQKVTQGVAFFIESFNDPRLAQRVGVFAHLLNPLAGVISSFQALKGSAEDAQKPIDVISSQTEQYTAILKNLKHQRDQAKIFANVNPEDAERVKILTRRIKFFQALLRSLKGETSPGDALSEGADLANLKLKQMWKRLKDLAKAADIKFQISGFAEGAAQDVARAAFGFRGQAANIRENVTGPRGRAIAAEAIDKLSLVTDEQIRKIILGSKSLDEFNQALRAAKDLGFEQFTSSDAGLMSKKAELVAKAFGDTGEALKENEAAYKGINSVIGAFQEVAERLPNEFGGAGDAARDLELALEGAREKAAKFAGKVLGSLAGGNAIGSAQMILDKIGGGLEKSLGQSDFFNDLAGSIGLSAGMGAAIGGAVIGIFSKAANMIKQGIGKLVSSLVDAGKSAFQDITGGGAGALTESVQSGLKQLSGAVAATALSILAAGQVLVGALFTILSPLVIIIPALTIIAGLLTVLSGGLPILIGAFFFLSGAALSLAQQTEDGSRLAGAFSNAVKEGVAPLNQFARRLFALVPLIAALTTVFATLAGTFASTLPEALFIGVKQVVLILLTLAVALESMRIEFNEHTARIGIVMGRLGLAVEQLELAFLKAVQSFGSLFGMDTQKVDSRISALEESTASSVEELAAMTSALGGTSSALDMMVGKIDEITNLSFGDAVEQGMSFADNMEELNDGLQESLLNVPQGFKVALERFRAITPGAGTSPIETLAGAGGASAGTTISVESLTVVAPNPEIFLDQMQEFAERQSFEQNGSLGGRQFRTGGGL